MSFRMSGYFESYSGWETTVIRLCLKFYRKYRCYPSYISVTEETMDELFDEVDREFNEPYSAEHGALSSNGKKLIAVHLDDNGEMIFPDAFENEDEEDDSWMIYGDDDGDEEKAADDVVVKAEPDESEEDEEIIEEADDDDCYPMEFGPNEDKTVSFKTNLFTLDFLLGEGFPEKYFELQFGDGPDGDGGEDFDEEESGEDVVGEKRIA